MKGAAKNASSKDPEWEEDWGNVHQYFSTTIEILETH
jgi:hypothetical protein